MGLEAPQLQLPQMAPPDPSPHLMAWGAQPGVQETRCGAQPDSPMLSQMSCRASTWGRGWL